jgi:glutaminyl-peptide cyclotransferase
MNPKRTSGKPAQTLSAAQRSTERLAILRWAVLGVAVIALVVLRVVWPRLRPAPAPELQVSPRAPVAAGAPRAPDRLKVKVLSTRPHDPEAFTQGLVLDGDTMLESTGINGRSSLREVDPRTGKVGRKVDVPSDYFAEGLALVDGRLIQLTWRAEKAFVYDRADLRQVGELRYDGEGWGLCWDGAHLVMSDGSDRLTFRDPRTFAVQSIVNVSLAGRPATQLNELECVDGAVYANVWQTDDILRIDPKDGRVTAVIDASGLLTPEERQKTDVLNGIAWSPKSKTFLITGKLWPKMFEVQFVPAAP